MWKIEAKAAYEKPKVLLSIKAIATNYTFEFEKPNGETINLGMGETAMLATEVAGGLPVFTLPCMQLETESLQQLRPILITSII